MSMTMSDLKFDIEYYEYLDELRESGETNMMGARPYLVEMFGMEKKEAGAILSDWMATFPRSKEDVVS